MLLLVCALLLLLFVALPLSATVVATPLRDIWAALNDAEVDRAMALSFGAGLVATILGALLGVPLAYLLARERLPYPNVVQTLLDLPLTLPHTAAGVALLVVFGRRGIVGAPASAFGLRFADTPAGIVVGMAFVSVPFLVSGATEAFRLIDPEIELVAQLDGASSWQAFLLVTLPLARRGILAGALSMWARGISEFGAVVVLAYHPRTVPVVVYERIIGLGLDEARAVTVLLIAAAVLVAGTLRLLSSGLERLTR